MRRRVFAARKPARVAAPAAEAAPAPAAARPDRQAPAHRPRTCPATGRTSPRQFVQQPPQGRQASPAWLDHQSRPAGLPPCASACAKRRARRLADPAGACRQPAPAEPGARPAADSAQTALQGDAAKLLDNMLRARTAGKTARLQRRTAPRAARCRPQAQALQPALEALLRAAP
jgi:DNA polymerase